jgi:hypothetical protein
MTGVTTAKRDLQMGPCVYLDHFYEEYQNNNISVDTVANAVYEKLLELQNDIPEVSVEELLSWESVRTHIYAKLVNAEMNASLLKELPHRLIMDLAIVYYIRVSTGEGSMGSILVHNKYMDLWNQEEEAFYQAAMENSRNEGEPSFKNLRACIPENMLKPMYGTEEVDTEIPMYVLTNQSKCLGAIEFVNTDTLNKISEYFHKDFVILPSSIHEVIIVPADGKFTFSEMADMVKMINLSTVNPEDRLSNHVYVYKCSDEKLEIAA